MRIEGVYTSMVYTSPNVSRGVDVDTRRAYLLIRGRASAAHLARRRHAADVEDLMAVVEAGPHGVVEDVAVLLEERPLFRRLWVGPK